MDREILLLIVYIVPVGVAFGVGFQLLRRLGKRRRTRVYERLCEELHLHACQPGKPVVPELKSTTQHIRGKWHGCDVRIFENVSDLVEPGETTAVQTYIMLSQRHWQHPHFLVEPRSMATNLRQKVDQRKGIFFPKDEAFTTRCFVDGPDHDAIRAALTPACMRLLRSNKHVYVDCRGGVILVYNSETLLSAGAVRELLDLGIAFSEGLAAK